MNLTEYRESDSEKLRRDDLLKLIPEKGDVALDIGARDGFYSLLLAERFDKVIALDLTKPDIAHPRVECVEGNAASLAFPDHSIDFIFCAEVLEHVPPELLPKVCSEIERVAKGAILIGVPYRQDIRVGRTTCQSCGGKNPPWGHVNSFDERRLSQLFAGSTVRTSSFVGKRTEQTNSLAVALMDLAGNPYGTYAQEEPCIHCGARLTAPPTRTLAQKILTKAAFWCQGATALFHKPCGNWIHILFDARAER